MFSSYPFTAADEASDRWKKLQVWLALQLPSNMSFRLLRRHVPGIGEEAVVLFSRPEHKDVELDAGLLLRGPAIALTDLEVQFDFGDPSEPVFFDYVREAPAPPPKRPTPLPAQPAGIGNETAQGSGVWFALPGDVRPDGAIVTVGGVQYRKHVRVQIGNLMSHFYKLA